MKRIRAAGVPIWISVFAVAMGCAGLVVGVVALIDPSLLFFTSADEALGQRWAGRQLGIAIVTIGAVILRSRSVYVLALLAGIVRELGDLVGAITEDLTPVPAIAFMLIGFAAVTHIVVMPSQEQVEPIANAGPQALRD